MYFDFEGRHFETPTMDSAMSWREQVLLSVFAHALVIAVMLVLPQLEFVRDAAERRAERLAALAELQAPVMQQVPQNDRQFVFIEPRVDLDAIEPPRPTAPFSDRDRVAQSPLRTDDPLNRLPNAEGNSAELVESDDPRDGFADTDQFGLLTDADSFDSADVIEDQLVELIEETDAELSDSSESEDETIDTLELDGSDVSALTDGSLPVPGVGSEVPDPPGPRIELPADGLLGSAMQNLERYVHRETFGNLSGDTGRYGPSIQFDSKGVEFGPWIRRFVAQIRRNWFVPYAMLTMNGNVVLTFFVHRDGTLTDLTVVQPSTVGGFTNSAYNALRSSNPTTPLPPDYPDDQAFFTVTFYFNEVPPLQ